LERLLFDIGQLQMHFIKQCLEEQFLSVKVIVKFTKNALHEGFVH